MDELSIYLHIPFCVKKCLYCDFLSFPAEEQLREQYVQALLREIRRESADYQGRKVISIFLGGGTPSLLSCAQLEAVFDCLHRCFEVGGETEVTLEANPGTVHGEWLKVCRNVGVNRLSIGLQSLQDKELALLGRIHRAEDFYRTFHSAREAGFSNINVDLMAALPGQKPVHYLNTLEQVAKLEPEHVSAYSLILEEGTPLWMRYGEGNGGCGSEIPPEEALPSEEEERAMDRQTEAFLSGKGYRRYEISNYARPGRECRHNTGCWKRKDYVGFGLGAASMVNNVRWRNTVSMERYLAEAGTAGHCLLEEHQRLSRGEQMEEFFFLGLRLTDGVCRRDFYHQFGEEMEAVYGTVLQDLGRKGLLTTGERICLTPYGRDVSNYVMAEFLF